MESPEGFIAFLIGPINIGGLLEVKINSEFTHTVIPTPSSSDNVYPISFMPGGTAAAESMDIFRKGLIPSIENAGT